MMGVVIAIHMIICILLIGIILIQAGRGGGLVEGFSGVESMFGTKTNTFLTRTTTTLSILFFITCLSLALLSIRQSRSLMRDVKIPKIEEKTPVAQAQAPQKEPVQEPQKEEPAQAPQQEEPKQELPKTE